MQNPFTTPAAQNFGLMLGRVSLGIYFMFQGYREIINDVDHFVAANTGRIPHWMPGQWGKEYLHFLPFAELVFGLLLAAGLKTRLSAFIVTIMLAMSFFIALGGLNPSGLTSSPQLIFFCLSVVLLTNGGGNLTLTNLMKGGAGGGGKPAGAK